MTLNPKVARYKDIKPKLIWQGKPILAQTTDQFQLALPRNRETDTKKEKKKARDQSRHLLMRNLELVR